MKATMHDRSAALLTVLVCNIKGGVGKTTIATHLASAFAAAGLRTGLADVDRQRSALGWIERRPASAAPILGLDWTRDIGETPRALQRLVIDAPAAIKVKDVETLIDRADVIVLPVLPGAFDEHATARFLGKLDELKRIRKQRIQVAVVGNRLRARTRAAERLDRFLSGLGHRVVTRLRDSQAYADAAAAGLSLHDLGTSRTKSLREEWSPLIAFVNEAG